MLCYNVWRWSLVWSPGFHQPCWEGGILHRDQRASRSIQSIQSECPPSVLFQLPVRDLPWKLIRSLILEGTRRLTDAPAAIGPYQQAIKANGFVFVSGCIPLTPTSMEVVEGGFDAQMHQVLRNLTAVVVASGSSLDKVVKTTVSAWS